MPSTFYVVLATFLAMLALSAFLTIRSTERPSGRSLRAWLVTGALLLVLALSDWSYRN
jgi:hypothetical protein